MKQRKLLRAISREVWYNFFESYVRISARYSTSLECKAARTIIKMKGGISLKIKLAVSKQRYKEVENTLTQCGLEIDDDADFTLSENNRYIDRLLVRDTVSDERVFLLVEDIVLIEAFGHSLEVHSKSNSYQLTERLYKVLDMLDPNQFLRISNSVVIARNKVKSISPTLSMKFILTMINGKKVDVTRSYYYIFKEYFGI